MTQYVNEKVERLEQPVTAWVLLGVIAMLIFAYAGFINATIAKIVAAKDMQSQVVSITSSVSDLESKYLAAKSAVTVGDALAMGFIQPTSDTTYISKVSVNSLSFNR